MKEYSLPKKEIKAILQTLADTWPAEAIPQKIKQVRLIEVEGKGEILILDEIAAVRTQNAIVPLLVESILQQFPSVTVDPGAIRFICNGADVMRPGVVMMSSFKGERVVAVKEQKYGKFISVGLALGDNESLEKTSSGPVVKNLHYVGDRFWKVFKEQSGSI